MTCVIYDNKPISFSQEKPVLLVEIYKDVAIEYGLQFISQEASGLLIRSIPLKQLNYRRLADGAFCIYTSQNSDCRFFMPSPNVKFAPLTMQRFTHTVDFKSMSRALQHPQLINGMSEVSLDVYANLWRAVGANIGRKLDGNIKWEKSFILN